MVLPVYVLVLESVKVPAPALVRPPEPEPITPDMVVSPVPFIVKRLLPLVMLPLNVAPPLPLLVMVPAPLSVMFLAELNAELPVMVKVPPPKVRPEFVPRLVSLDTLITPLVIVVRPEYEFEPFDKVKVLELDVSLVKAPVPEIIPESVWAVLEEYLNVPLFTILPA